MYCTEYDIASSSITVHIDLKVDELVAVILHQQVNGHRICIPAPASLL